MLIKIIFTYKKLAPSALLKKEQACSTHQVYTPNGANLTNGRYYSYPHLDEFEMLSKP